MYVFAFGVFMSGHKKITTQERKGIRKRAF
jgi:hypothetical protein